MTDPSIFANLDNELRWQRELYKEFHRTPELSLEEHQRQTGSKAS